MTFYCWVFRRRAFRRWVFRPNMDGIPATYYIYNNYMTFHCWVFRCWVFEAYCREYPTRNLELGIPAVGYSTREPLPTPF